MAIVRETFIRWNGLSSDAKPSSPTPVTGATFKETDTGLEYFYNGSAWVLKNYNVNPVFGKKTGVFCPRGNVAAASGMFAVMISAVNVGTGTTTTVLNDANGIGCTPDTGGTINGLAGWKCTTLTTRRSNPVIMFKFQLVATANFRFFAGFSSTGGTNPASNSDYLANLSGVGLWVDDGVSANWKIMHNAASASSTIDNTSTGFDANLHTLSITATDSGTPTFTVQLDGVTMTNGAPTAAIPAQTTLMSPIIYMENTTGASRTYNLYKEWIEADL